MTSTLVRQSGRRRILQISKLFFRVSSKLTAHHVQSDEKYLLARPFNDIPGPPGLPFFGSVFEFIREGGAKNFHRIDEQRFEKFGPIYKERMLGKTNVHLNDASAVETLLRADGKYPKKPPVVPMLENEKEYQSSFVNTNAEDLIRIRKTLASKMMLPKSVQKNMENFNGVTDDFIKRLKNLPGNNDPVIVVNDLLPHLFEWSTESIATFIFDTRIGLFANPPSKEARNFIKVTHYLVTDVMPEVFLSPPFILYFKKSSIKKFVKGVKKLRAYVENTITRKFKELHTDISAQGKETFSGHSILSHVMSSKELSSAEIFSSLCDLFGGGVDTTSYTAQWLLYNLARNVEVQEKLFEEVHPLLNKTGFLAADDLSKIPYLKACLKESNRLTPISSIISRITQTNLVICGYQVPAGTEVNFNNYVAGRSEKNFDEPKKFKPERWLKNEEQKVHPFTVLPFGHGPRMCLGMRVAETEIFSLISKLIANYEVRMMNEEEVKSIFNLLLIPEKPLGFVFVKRS